MAMTGVVHCCIQSLRNEYDIRVESVTSVVHVHTSTEAVALVQPFEDAYFVDVHWCYTGVTPVQPFEFEFSNRDRRRVT